ncbi:hypothetical protein THASP1DRAFT_23167, partial [Thamnocephalis sphaerospora]
MPEAADECDRLIRHTVVHVSGTVQVDAAKVRREAGTEATRTDAELFSPDEERRQTAQLQARIEQAVYFGTFDQNPLSFELGSQISGNLDVAVLKVCGEILTSSSKHAPTMLNVSLQLAERLKCAKSIMDFINSCGLQHR